MLADSDYSSTSSSVLCDDKLVDRSIHCLCDDVDRTTMFMLIGRSYDVNQLLLLVVVPIKPSTTKTVL